MSDVTFFKPVVYDQENRSCFQTLCELSDSLLAPCSDQRFQVIRIADIQGKITEYGFFDPKTQSFLSMCVKILLCCTVILPLIALIVKAIHRSTHDFRVLPKPSAPSASSTIVETTQPVLDIPPTSAAAASTTPEKDKLFETPLAKLRTSEGFIEIGVADGFLCSQKRSEVDGRSIYSKDTDGITFTLIELIKRNQKKPDQIKPVFAHPAFQKLMSKSTFVDSYLFQYLQDMPVPIVEAIFRNLAPQTSAHIDVEKINKGYSLFKEILSNSDSSKYDMIPLFDLLISLFPKAFNRELEDIVMRLIHGKVAEHKDKLLKSVAKKVTPAHEKELSPCSNAIVALLKAGKVTPAFTTHFEKLGLADQEAICNIATRHNIIGIKPTASS